MRVALHLSSDSVAAISSELLHITGLLLFLAAVASVLILIYAPLRLLMRAFKKQLSQQIQREYRRKRCGCSVCWY